MIKDLERGFISMAHTRQMYAKLIDWNQSDIIILIVFNVTSIVYLITALISNEEVSHLAKVDALDELRSVSKENCSLSSVSNICLLKLI